MEKVAVGKSVQLTRIIQGFWRLTSWNWTAAELEKFMRQGIELGVTSFDTAEIYGATECETQMGQVLQGNSSLRQQMQIITKTGISKGEGGFGYYDTRKERILASCEASLRRLGCDYIDVYLIHREDPALDPWEVADALAELVKKGWVREVGVSNFDPFKFDALQTATGGKLATNQIEWSPLCYEHFNSGMMDVLLKEKIHPMIWSPLAGGRIFMGETEESQKVLDVLEPMAEKYNTNVSTLVYAWLMYHPVQAMPICGSSNIARLQQAVQALDIKLDHADWYKIYTASGQQKLR